MATPTLTKPGRSGPEIRAALAAHAPSELRVFEEEFHRALADTATSFDTTAVEQVLTRWWPVAVTRSLQLTDAEQEQVRQAKTGIYAGLLEQADDGSFHRIP